MQAIIQELMKAIEQKLSKVQSALTITKKNCAAANKKLEELKQCEKEAIFSQKRAENMLTEASKELKDAQMEALNANMKMEEMTTEIVKLRSQEPETILITAPTSTGKSTPDKDMNLGSGSKLLAKKSVGFGSSGGKPAEREGFGSRNVQEFCW